jgi:hypothetical protein
MELKLAKLPDRTPVKLTIGLMPELHDRLRKYAACYAEAYDSEETIVELIPAMLSAFLDSDRGFARHRRGDK